jgi:hypothetical protein
MTNAYGRDIVLRSVQKSEQTVKAPHKAAISELGEVGGPISPAEGGKKAVISSSSTLIFNT